VKEEEERRRAHSPLPKPVAEVARMEHERAVAALDEVRADLVPPERAAAREEEDGGCGRGVHDLPGSVRTIQKKRRRWEVRCVRRGWTMDGWGMAWAAVQKSQRMIFSQSGRQSNWSADMHGETYRVMRSDSWKICTNSGETCESGGSASACRTLGESWIGPGMLQGEEGVSFCL
jgi:hypothetical protein